MSSKPSNWYAMTYGERREWEKAHAAAEEAEYQADQAQQRASRAEANAARQHQEQKAERERHQYATADLEARIDELESEAVEYEEVLQITRNALADLEEAAGIAELWLSQFTHREPAAIVEDLKGCRLEARKVLDDEDNDIAAQ